MPDDRKPDIDSLIEALTIFKKYIDPTSSTYMYPTCCEHDYMYVGVDPNEVSPEDLASLAKLSFRPDEETGGFSSSHFGSS